MVAPPKEPPPASPFFRQQISPEGEWVESSFPQVEAVVYRYLGIDAFESIFDSLWYGETVVMGPYRYRQIHR